MALIVRSDFNSSANLVAVLEKTLDGGFVPREEFDETQQDLCEIVNWIESAVKFRCDCGDWHTAQTKDAEYDCPVRMYPVKPDETIFGFRRKANISLDLDLDVEYELEIAEHTSRVSVSEFDDKAIVFAPDVDSLEFPDRVGRVVWLPLCDLPNLVSEEDRTRMLSNIRERRRNFIDWERLENTGDDFEEITYRLIARSDLFYNRSWGGRGPDQGKDAYCSVDTGGPGTRVLVQAKGQPESSLNKTDIREMVQDAASHDCEGLLVTTINITGDAETKYERGGYRTASVPYIKIWPGVEIKERLSRHPDLISEYFINE